MVCLNIFRSLPPTPPPPGGEENPGGGAAEDGEEEAYADPAWPHLQLVYEFLLRFIVSAEVKAKSAKRYIDTLFCSRLIEMFDSEDMRERDYLKVRRGERAGGGGVAEEGAHWAITRSSSFTLSFLLPLLPSLPFLLPLLLSADHPAQDLRQVHEPPLLHQEEHCQCLLQVCL